MHMLMHMRMRVHMHMRMHIPGGWSESEAPEHDQRRCCTARMAQRDERLRVTTESESFATVAPMPAFRLGGRGRGRTRRAAPRAERLRPFRTELCLFTCRAHTAQPGSGQRCRSEAPHHAWWPDVQRQLWVLGLIALCSFRAICRQQARPSDRSSVWHAAMHAHVLLARCWWGA